MSRLSFFTGDLLISCIDTSSIHILSSRRWHFLRLHSRLLCPFCRSCSHVKVRAKSYTSDFDPRFPLRRQISAIFIRTSFTGASIIILHCDVTSHPFVVNYQTLVSSRLPTAIRGWSMETLTSIQRILSLLHYLKHNLNYYCWKFGMDTPNLGCNVRNDLEVGKFIYIQLNFPAFQVDPSWPDAKHRVVVVFLHRDVWLLSTFLFDGLFSASPHLCGSDMFKVPVRDICLFAYETEHCNLSGTTYCMRPSLSLASWERSNPTQRYLIQGFSSVWSPFFPKSISVRISSWQYIVQSDFFALSRLETPDCNFPASPTCLPSTARFLPLVACSRNGQRQLLLRLYTRICLRKWCCSGWLCLGRPSDSNWKERG